MKKHSKQDPWTEKEIRAIARKYKTRDAWQKGHQNSYSVSARRGQEFHARMCRHMKYASYYKNPPPKSWGYWTKARVVAEGRKYKTTAAWRKHSMSSYITAYRNGWHRGVIQLTGTSPAGRHYWTDAVITKYIKRSPKISDVKTWKALHPRSYRIAESRGAVSRIVAAAL